MLHLQGRWMIHKHLIINKTDSEVRIALLENNRVAELVIERKSEKSIVGNIYKGIVTRVMPGMNAAFVDIGLEKSAFLYGGDTYSPEQLEQALILGDNFFTKDLAKEDTKEERQVNQIGEILRDGQQIVVQVTKEPIGTKGPRVTMHPTIAGRFLVLVPFTMQVSLSRKIENEEERTRLTSIIEKLVTQAKIGLIARTASQGISRETIVRDFNILKKNWGQIQQRINNHIPKTILYHELDIIKRSVRDFFDEGVRTIIIDDYTTYKQLRSFISEHLPEAFKCLNFFDESIPIFDLHGIEVDIARSLGKKIELPSGGYLIIEQTEALTTFDINTGKYIGKANAQQTILKTNMEAAEKIVEQLRIRNIGGIIIVDFIDMEEEENRQKLFQRFSEELTLDRALTNILPLSELGLIQMTRKRTAESLERKLTVPCPYCEGHGRVKSVQTEALDLLREAVRRSIQTDRKKILVQVRTDIKDWIHIYEKNSLKRIQEDLGIEIEFLNSRLNVDLLREMPFEVIE